MARIFISYARKDGSIIADELADRLRALNHEVFLDIQGIPGGTEWEKQLIERANWCDILLVLITEASNQSRYVYDEFREAEKNKKLIIPVQVEDSPLPPHISHLNALPFKGNNYDAFLLKLEVALRNLQTSKSGLSLLQIAVPVAILLVIIAVVVMMQLGNNTDGDSEKIAEPPTATNTDIPSDTPEPPTATNTDVPTPVDTSTPTLTRTPRPPTSTPFVFSGGLYDDFSDNKLNFQLWSVDYASASAIENIVVSPIDGVLQISNSSSDTGNGFFLNFQGKYGSQYTMLQLDMKMIKSEGTSNITLNTVLGSQDWLEFGIGRENNKLMIFAQTRTGSRLFQLPANYDEWYTLKIENIKEQSSLELYVNNNLLGTYEAPSTTIRSSIQLWRGSSSYTVEGFIDNVYIEYND